MAGVDPDGTLVRIEQLLRTVVRLQLGPILERELEDGRLAELYEMTGQVTANDATKKLGCSKTTVIEAWQRWERLGLIVKEGKTFRKVI